jgi:hypothetical protein
MNLASTQLRTLSTVELELMQRRRTSDSHAARIEGVTSAGIFNSSFAPAELENAINAIVTTVRMFICSLAIIWIEEDAFDPMRAAKSWRYAALRHQNADETVFRTADVDNTERNNK